MSLSRDSYVEITRYMYAVDGT